jgi:hypothetical protein
MNRRRFTRASITAFGATGMGLVACRAVGVDGALKPLSREYPPAQALKYVDNAADADPSVYPADGSQKCKNCRHYQGGDNPRGACALFNGFSVSSSGWCTGWVAQQ